MIENEKKVPVSVVPQQIEAADPAARMLRVCLIATGSDGDFIVAQRTLALNPSMNALKLKFARDYSSGEIEANSVVWIGSRQSTPWVDLFGCRMNFSTDYDAVHHKSCIRNRRPSPEEAPLSMLSDDKSGALGSFQEKER